MIQSIDWYFDFISPFAYLQFEKIQTMPELPAIHYKPILFAGLLNHWGHKGPAEIASKRRFTYRFALWLARKEGIPLTSPPAHPFNPLHALRLALAAQCQPDAIGEIFRLIWRRGRSTDDRQAWQELCATVGLTDADSRITAPKIKNALRDNTEEAISRGVFGVPTFVAGDEIFWGLDATEMLTDYLHAPQDFDDAEMRRVEKIPVGALR